jgi:thiamine-phosphate pyrophosphorylase
LQREAKPILCYVTDRATLRTGEDLPVLVRRSVGAGVDWVQLREKDLPAERLLELARTAVATVEGTATRVLINDRLDVALAAGAAGVHLGEASLPVAEVVRWCREANGKRRAPKGFLVGASCHSLASAREAERGGADYIFFGPVFRTPSKATYGPPQGLAKLAEVARSVRLPVLAIGGIILENAAACLKVGAAGLAAIRLFQESPDLAATVAQLRAADPPPTRDAD